MLTREVELAKIVEPQCPRGCTPENWKHVVFGLFVVAFLLGFGGVMGSIIGYDKGRTAGFDHSSKYYTELRDKELIKRLECVVERKDWITGPETCFPNIHLRTLDVSPSQPMLTPQQFKDKIRYRGGR